MLGKSPTAKESLGCHRICGEIGDKFIIDLQNFVSRADLPENNDPDKYDAEVASKLDSE